MCIYFNHGSRVWVLYRPASTYTCQLKSGVLLNFMLLGYLIVEPKSLHAQVYI